MSAVRTWWVGRDVYGDKDSLYFCTFPFKVVFLPCFSSLMLWSFRAKSNVYDMVSITPPWHSEVFFNPPACGTRCVNTAFREVSTSKNRFTDSDVRFSAEITGTIIVQCIPVLRPFLQEVHAAISSRTFGHSSSNAKTTVSRNKFDPSGGTYSVTVTTIAAEKAAQKGSNVDTYGARSRASREYRPQPPSPGSSEEFELPIQNTNSTNSGWSPVNSRE